MKQGWHEWALSRLLYLLAGILFLALPAAFLPTDWMDRVHRFLGLGPLPRSPLMEYLTRSVSLVYAAASPFLVMMALDLRRYLPLIRLLGWVLLAGAGTFVALDLWADLPLFWTVIEGTSLLLMGLGVIALEGQVRGLVHNEKGVKADTFTPEERSPGP